MQPSKRVRIVRYDADLVAVPTAGGYMLGATLVPAGRPVCSQPEIEFKNLAFGASAELLFESATHWLEEWVEENRGLVKAHLRMPAEETA